MERKWKGTRCGAQTFFSPLTLLSLYLIISATLLSYIKATTTTFPHLLYVYSFAFTRTTFFFFYPSLMLDSRAQSHGQSAKRVSCRTRILSNLNVIYVHEKMSLLRTQRKKKKFLVLVRLYFANKEFYLFQREDGGKRKKKKVLKNINTSEDGNNI